MIPAFNAFLLIILIGAVVFAIKAAREFRDPLFTAVTVVFVATALLVFYVLIQPV